jgi:hypothetical protein
VRNSFLSSGVSYAVGRGLLDEVEGEVAEVLGDGAYDVQDCYRATRERGARSVIPPKQRARVGGGPVVRDRDAAVLRGREAGRGGRKEETATTGGVRPGRP